MFGADLGRLSDFVAKYINVLVDAIWRKLNMKLMQTNLGSVSETIKLNKQE